MWKCSEAAAEEYQKTKSREALLYLYQDNIRITNKVSSKFLDTFERDIILSEASEAIILAAQKYEHGRGDFSSFYWTVFNNKLISLARKKSQRYAKRIKTWGEFERVKRQYRDIFDRRMIKREFHSLQDEDYDKLSAKEKDYIALMLHISVTNEIAFQALGMSRSGFYKMKNRIVGKLLPYFKAIKERREFMDLLSDNNAPSAAVAHSLIASKGQGVTLEKKPQLFEDLSDTEILEKEKEEPTIIEEQITWNMKK